MNPPTPHHRQPLLLAAATAVVLAFFLTKAFHIDDPLFLWIARQIQHNPFNPLGFDVVWYVTKMPMHAITKNPPLVSYVIAPWASIGGWSEAWIHLLFFVPAIAVVLGTHRLARLLGASPLVAALGTLASPAFLVSATTVTCDVSMLALFLWAVVFWVDGVDRQDRQRLLLAAFVAGLAALTKYFAISLIPLFIAYTLIRRRAGWKLLWPLVVTIGMLAAYQAWTSLAYGRGLLLDAAAYATSFRQPAATGLWTRLLVGLSFVGGGVPVALLLAPALLRGRALVITAVVAVAAAVVAFTPPLAPDSATGAAPAAGAGVAITFRLFVAAAAAAVVLAVREILAARRDAGAWLLALWVLGTLVFAAVVNWTANGRSVLPLVPAIALLAGRVVARGGVRMPRWGVPIILSFVVAVLAAAGDLGLANAGRTAARTIMLTPSAGRTWFQGHWGFQWYMEQAGALPVDVKGSMPTPGERMVRPLNNTNTFVLPPTMFAHESMLTIPVKAPASLMGTGSGAGFYASIWGPLPFAFGTPPPEQYEILRALPRGAGGAAPPGK